MKQQTNFKNVYVHDEGDKKVFCYRTGLCVYEEVLHSGCLASAGWNTAGYTLNVLDDMPTRLNADLFTEAQSFDAEADGVSLSWDWEYVGFDAREETLEGGTVVTHARVILKNRLKPIEATVHTQLDGGNIFTRWIELKNVGDTPTNINVLAPMCGGIENFERWKDYMNGTPDPGKIYSLGYMGSAAHNHEGAFAWHKLTPGIQSIDGNYLFDRYRHPMFLLRNNLTGTVLTAQLGWSGGYRFEFVLDTDVPNNDPANARMSFRADVVGQKPITVLSSGESLESPQMHIGMLSGDLDDAVNAMHRHLRRTVFTLPAVRGVKGWVEGGMGPERTMDVTAAKHFIDTIATVGGETFIIDAGWYCPRGTEVKEWWQRTGDWYHDTEKYPDGMKEIREYAHSKGLLFGLWLDLERLGPDSKIANEHPEWISENYKRWDNGSQLNMAIPEAAAWAEAELCRVIEEYKIDLFRLDYNLHQHNLQNRYRGANGEENAFLRYYRNTLAMYERLRRKYPDVVFENCAGGGGRTDVAFVRNFTHTWVSDHNVAPRSFSITNGMTMALPPELVDRLASGMGCHTAAALSWQIRNTIFGRPTTNDYNAVGSEMNTEQLKTVKHTFDIYKNHVRPYIDKSLIFHHTPELVGDPTAPDATVEQPRGTGILERASEDGCHGVIGVFNLADATDTTVHTVYPRGIDPSRSYAVTFDNCGATVELSGAEMMQRGLRATLSGSLSSELIVYEAK